MDFLHSPQVGKRITKPRIAIALASIGFLILNILFGQTIRAILKASSLTYDSGTFTNLLLRSIVITFTFSPIVLALFLFVKNYEKRDISTLGFSGNRPLLKFFRGALLSVFMLSCVVLLLYVFKQIKVNAGDSEMKSGSVLFGMFLLLLARVIQAGSEEVIFRGWLLPTLSIKWGGVTGVLVSSLVFGLLHTLNNLSVLAVFNLILYGAFLALYAIVDGSIWGVCAWHIFWNWIEGGVLGFAESGQSSGKGLLFNTQFIGHPFLTGGSTGTNGSFFLTVVLSCGILLLILKLQKRLVVFT